MAVDKIAASLTIERENAELAVFEPDRAIAVPQVLALISGVTKIAIFAVPPVVRVFTVFVARTDVVWNGRFAKEFPHLLEYWF